MLAVVAGRMPPCFTASAPSTLDDVGAYVWTNTIGIEKQNNGYLYVTGTYLETNDLGYNNLGTSGAAYGNNIFYNRNTSPKNGTISTGDLIVSP